MQEGVFVAVKFHLFHTTHPAMPQHPHMVSVSLQERNRKLNTEVTKLKNQAVEQHSDIQQLQQQLQKAYMQQHDQHGLIKQLEMDLVHR